MTKSQEQLEIDNCELNHVLLTQQTFVSSKSREEKAYFEQAIQPKLIANLLAKKGAPFLISISGQRRNIDVVVDGSSTMSKLTSMHPPRTHLSERPLLKKKFR